MWDLRRPGSAPLRMPKASDPGVLSRISSGSIPPPVFNSDGKWLIYQYRLFDLRGKQPTARDLNGPEEIKDVFAVSFSSDGTWAIGEKDFYKVLWDLQASVMSPQLFVTRRDHAPKQMDAFAPEQTDSYTQNRGKGYRPPTINLPLVLDDLAELACKSAGFDLTAEERRDLLLPENEIATVKSPPNSRRSPCRTVE